MSIDRIGKGAGSSGVLPTQPAGSERVTGGGSFNVSRSSSAESAKAAEQPLERLRSGQISVSEYLDLRVEAATQHLVGRLQPDQLEFIRQSLRDQLSSDPVLVDMVHAATGALPSAAE